MSTWYKNQPKQEIKQKAPIQIVSVSLNDAKNQTTQQSKKVYNFTFRLAP